MRPLTAIGKSHFDRVMLHENETLSEIISVKSIENGNMKLGGSHFDLISFAAQSLAEWKSWVMLASAGEGGDSVDSAKKQLAMVVAPMGSHGREGLAPSATEIDHFQSIHHSHATLHDRNETP